MAAVQITGVTITAIRRNGRQIEVVVTVNPLGIERTQIFDGKPTQAEVNKAMQDLMTTIQNFLDFEDQAQAYIGVTIPKA